MAKKGRPKGQPNEWAKLYGSKREITKKLTGRELPPPVSLADDLLEGAEEISAYSGLPVSTVYNKSAALGLRRLLKTPEAA